MIIDYHEAEENGDLLLVRMGLQFEDEPEALYLAVFTCIDGVAHKAQLFYNGMDCKYTYRPEELSRLAQYLKEQGISIQIGLEGGDHDAD